MDDVMGWQKRFYAQPRVWFVISRNEETGNYYDCKEGAELEANFLTRHGQHSRIGSTPMHSLQLSKERWDPPRGEGEKP